MYENVQPEPDDSMPEEDFLSHCAASEEPDFGEPPDLYEELEEPDFDEPPEPQDLYEELEEPDFGEPPEPPDIYEELEEPDFGESLRHERAAHRWSQRELAERIGASQQAIAHWENGRMLPRREKFAKLLDLFGHDSPVANFALRGQRLTARPKSAIMTNVHAVVGSGTAGGTRTLAKCLDSQETAPLLGDLKEFLPDPYRVSVDKRIFKLGHRLELDYLSNHLAVEIKPIRSGSPQTAVSLGLHQLNKARLLLADKPPEEIDFVLILVGDVPDNLGLLKRSTSDALLFGIELIVVPNMAKAGEFIYAAETQGLRNIMAADDGDDDDY